MVSEARDAARYKSLAWRGNKMLAASSSQYRHETHMDYKLMVLVRLSFVVSLRSEDQNCVYSLALDRS